MVTRLARWLALFSVLACAATQAAVELNITPDPAVANQSLELSFRVTGQVAADPDFSPLESAFEILGRNRQTTMSWINGRSEQSTTWVLNTMPRASGRVDIPAISFGNQTSAARTLEVGDAPAPAPGANDDADITLKVTATPLSPYVQQQVIYTVRLLHRVELSNPRFSPLAASGDAVIKPLGNGRQFSQQINGRSYEGFEQKYAVFAQKSGKLRIAPLTLTTEVVVGQRSVFDPFAQSLSTHRVEAEAVELDVRPVPASFPRGATWLPAKRLRLHEEWEPDVNSAEVGAPLTRTVFLWVDGLLSGQLASPKLAAPDGIKLYPDQAQTSDQDTANGFTAVLQQKYALIASQAGAARFGEMAVPWWNVETDQLEIARLPERTLTVNAASGASPAPLQASPAGKPAASGDLASAPAAAPAVAATRALRWPLVALLLGVAWLLTLALWWRSHRRFARNASDGRPDENTASSVRARTALKDACGANDARAARAALMQWALAAGGQWADVRSLRELGERAGGDLGREIERLERHLYSADTGAWQGQTLWRTVQQLPSKRAVKAAEAELPRLFKLGAR